MPVDYSVYLVTDRGILGGRDLFKAVEDAIKGGASLLQLREKDISSRAFYDLAVKMKDLANSYDVPLIINDRLDIALAVDADGLHIGQDDIPLRIAREIMGPDKIIGYSVSNPEQALFGEKNGADYLGAGPVYATGSKADAGLPIGPGTLKTIKDSVSIPVVAIGGVGITNISEVKKTGVDGISVISAILGKLDIVEAAKNITGLWKDI
ncbi:Thiamine-phosphate synthase [Pelotomaculum schinkii]|uniref:Thiamine-phosphate synthase n=1 Tax=Pelotomaculum schinkii TaxID=78350 RepID=A0A4Y7R8D7_9FIRM|nr:thiamine phosphate synthase [Pelotomaculum schinkii]TEB05235.1 Thiamine-phosphate synthase [Pelotomaculum schinkii]